MPYRLDQINQAVRQDPAAFMAAGDAAFHEKVCRAADLIQSHRDKSPVVLLSGPSGSGKTTTAGMINAELASTRTPSPWTTIFLPRIPTPLLGLPTGRWILSLP